ncbi:MAG: hypothetical protein ABIR62_17400, partial [Dokdonella sp.]|uniref:hypothetical protein n=1 Tax=Dokdonella sp. TaxID=2291710 RepID=UPI003266AC4F
VPYTVAYATNQIGFPVQDDFYVAGSVTSQGDSDVLVQKISGVTGAYKTEFDGNGSASIDFAHAGGSHDDYAGGLYVYRDDVYIAAQVAKSCTTGVGVARLNGTTGTLNTAFGIGGKVEFGGTDPATCNVSYTQSVSPTAMSATGGRLGIVGSVRSLVQGVSDQTDPLLGVVDAVNGNILDWSRRPIRRLDSTTYGSGIAYTVFGGPDPSSPFTVAGTVHDDANGGHLDFFTSVFRPSSDLIFYSGVEVVRQIPD